MESEPPNSIRALENPAPRHPEETPPLDGPLPVPQMEALIPSPAVLPTILPPSLPSPTLISVQAQDSVWNEASMTLEQIANGITVADQKSVCEGASRVDDVIKKLDALLSSSPSGLLGDPYRVSNGQIFETDPRSIRFTCVEESELDGDLWFIGDLHGDILSYRALKTYAKSISKREDKKARFFFIGDLFDDGMHGHLVLLEFFEDLIEAGSGHVGFVVGNHDIGLHPPDDSGVFTSSVTPCDFADWLNAPSTPEHWRKLATRAVEFFKIAPRACLLPHGVLVSHGGVPHKDLQAGLNAPADLQREECLQDFVWTRAHDTSPRKVPNRSTNGCQFGIQDFQDFCELAAKLLRLPVRGLVRGHDHVQNRYDFPIRYRPHWLLTLNAMSTRQRDPYGPYERRPVIARYIPNQPPEIHQIEIPAELVRAVYPPPALNPSNIGE